MKKVTLCMIAVAMALVSSNKVMAEEHIVKVMTDYENMRMYFEPLNLTIEPGDTVTWVNQDAEDHNMVTFPDGYPKDGKGFHSPYLTKEGEKWSHKFEVPGTYNYHCIPHLFMGMRGNITVGWASAPEDYHVPTPEEVAAYRTELLKFFDTEDFEHAPDYVRAKRKALAEKCKDICAELDKQSSVDNICISNGACADAEDLSEIAPAAGTADKGAAESWWDHFLGHE